MAKHAVVLANRTEDEKSRMRLTEEHGTEINALGMAIMMLDDGLSIEKTAKYTGLSLEKIQLLKLRMDSYDN